MMMELRFTHARSLWSISSSIQSKHYCVANHLCRVNQLHVFLLFFSYFTKKIDPRSRNDPEECCKRPMHLKHPYCDEIRIPDDDYFYRLFNVKCIDFVRAFPSPRPGCKLGSRAQFNTLTSVIDANTVYGVKEEFTRKLRTGFGGLLRMNPVFAEYGLKDLLPLKLDFPDEGCTRPNKSMFVNSFLNARIAD